MASPTCGYHLTAKAVSFGKGQSAVHRAAYNARCQLRDERNQKETNDYSRASALLFSGIFAPKDAPEWAKDREQLWNRAEAAERQWNGQPARNLDMAFPDKLNQQQREWLIKDFVREQFVRKGMVADVNIHAPHPGGDERNYHAHVMLTMREIDGEGFAKTKNRDWNRKETLETWRERWAEMGGRALERAGYQIEADRWRNGHRTLSEQREAALKMGDREYAEAINREATQHRGPNIGAMERKGIETERGNIHRDTEERGAQLGVMKSQLEDLDREIEEETRRGGRWVDGPQRGGMVEHQSWAQEEVRARSERRRQEEQALRPEKQTDGQEIDLTRFRSDPDYRREITAGLAQKRREQRDQQRSNQEREPREREDRQR
jgi:hypothetical protein